MAPVKQRPKRSVDRIPDVSLKMGFHPTRENVENYIGRGSEKEGSLPDSIITQFTLSVMNMNSNASFPRWLKERILKSIDMPVLALFGENEFAFNIRKAEKRARKCIQHLEIEIIKDASHLIPVSKPEYINGRILRFWRFIIENNDNSPWKSTIIMEVSDGKDGGKTMSSHRFYFIGYFMLCMPRPA